ncbi:MULTISPECIES: AEC family transporter [Spirosoma]|uniref:AEC family transporter n=1 Tax=Spirosoma liriopis TaxID=2937440 RepID=A0ABT0HN63_9BACT|nr:MULTISPECIES: AEC family transporter [Spirosoma]MCK8493312.1 AEC family transporter [Spirosoma liriopis]UHG92702.1 AEC family transporter [Spirosoma oryzicola]
MNVLSELLTSVVPLYGFIILGYVASRWLGLKSKPISSLLLYVLIPLVIFDNILKAEPAQLATAMGIIFLLAALMNIPAQLAGRRLGGDINQDLLRCSFSYFNIGWFGIPVVMALFGEEKMPLIISAYMGNVLYGDTVGYYLISRSKDMGVGDSVKNVLKIPAIYALVAAIIANAYGFTMPESLEPVMKGASWTLSALGMTIIGVTLTAVDVKKVDYSLFSKIMAVRYVAAAVILGALVWLESIVLGKLEGDDQKLILLMASFPIAANLVVFATFIDSETENASILVTFSSIISLFLVPATCLLLFQS